MSPALTAATYRSNSATLAATSVDAQAPDCAFAFMVVSAEPAMAADTSNARRSSIFFSFAVE
jgi:hypothetical protein